MPTTDSVQNQINNIVQRVTALDGIGLTQVVQGQTVSRSGQISTILALIAGLKKTLGNVNMGYQTEIGALQTDYAAFKLVVSGLLNIPSGPSA